jgi:16S rRNA (cytidine1402-2'-O)-methyltransferase
MAVKGILYLIPCPIAETSLEKVIPSGVSEAIRHIKYFLVEDIRSGRRFLKAIGLTPDELQFQVLNKDTKYNELATLCQPLLTGQDAGVISEAGSPGVADPGALAVRFAHEHEIRVVPLVGPSSILLALMASGLNGQQFAFHGYLPRDQKEAAAKIREFERESRSRSQTQIFIETPHRNNSLFEVLVKTLQPDSLLSIAIDVTGASEIVKTRTASQWREQKTSWPKSPAVFMFLAG